MIPTPVKTQLFASYHKSLKLSMNDFKARFPDNATKLNFSQGLGLRLFLLNRLDLDLGSHSRYPSPRRTVIHQQCV